MERDEEVSDIVEKLGKLSRIGMDLEGEWNLHRYGLHLCLIQMGDGENCYLFDPVKLNNLAPVFRLMEDPDILKISHGPQSDLVLLDYRYDVHPKNLFDTEKAAQLLGYESTSLSGLLEAHFGITKNTKVRASNWNTRPLPEKMLNYAALDVAFLYELHDALTAELEEKNRFHWHQEENERLEEIRFKPKDNPHLELKGAEKLTRRQGEVLKYLYNLRDEIAEDNDRPAYHIIQNKLLVNLAENPPATPEEWKHLKGVNPRVKHFANEFHGAVKKGLSSQLPTSDSGDRFATGKDRKAWYSQVNRVKDTLDVLRKAIEDEHELSHLILSSRTVKRIAYGEFGFEDLREWQKEILREKADEIGLDLAKL